MEVEAHEYEPTFLDQNSCIRCRFRENHPVHVDYRKALGIQEAVWVDVPPKVKVLCKHESWTCSGSSPWVKHSCNDCDWNWTNSNNPNFKYCDLCKDAKYPKSKEYVTKDSGKREEFDSGMVRDTQDDKPRFDLLFPLGIPYSDQFLTRVAELLARGAVKYDARNWEKAAGQAELDRFKASAMRHLIQWQAGETDEDHAAAVVFNLMGAHLVEWKLLNGK